MNANSKKVQFLNKVEPQRSLKVKYILFSPYYLKIFYQTHQSSYRVEIFLDDAKI